MAQKCSIKRTERVRKYQVSMTSNTDKSESRHGATDPEKCRNMEEKYGWKLLRIEPTGDKILKVDCVFKGVTEFPSYHQED
jgi:hypothetical protein